MTDVIRGDVPKITERGNPDCLSDIHFQATRVSGKYHNIFSLGDTAEGYSKIICLSMMTSRFI